MFQYTAGVDIKKYVMCTSYCIVNGLMRVRIFVIVNMLVNRRGASGRLGGWEGGVHCWIQ